MPDPTFAAAYLEVAEDALRIHGVLAPGQAIRAALNIGVAIAISLQEGVDVLREINDALHDVDKSVDARLEAIDDTLERQ